MAAKLLHSFLLCSDINLKSLIGISIDVDNHLLITCKSFVKRFNLQNRKQVNSWITNSWHPFSAAVVRDHSSDKIVSVINKNLICQWSNDEVHIESIKKITLKNSVHQLINYNKTVYVLYECGYVESLEKALKTTKEPKSELLGSSNKQIVDSLIIDKDGTSSVVLLTKDEDGAVYEFYTYELDSNIPPSSLVLKLQGHTLMGSCILESGKLLTFWNDGNLYSMNALAPQTSLNPGTLQGSLDFLKISKKVKMCQLGSSHLVIQGMDVSEEGGVIALWDTKFGVKVSMKPMKMYIDPPLAWSLSSGVVVGDGKALVYVPVSLKSSVVASMLGSRPPETSTESSSTDWDVFDFKNVLSNQASPELAQVIQSICEPSHTDSLIIQSVVNHLVEKKNTQLLLECLQTFELIPEKCLVAILELFLKIPTPESNGVQGGTSTGNCRFGAEKERLISRIISHSFNPEDLLVSLRTIDFDKSWQLIQHLHSLLASGNILISSQNKESLSVVRVCTWLCSLLDANYHQLVMTSEDIIHVKLKEVLSDVASLHQFLEASQSIGVLVDQAMLGQEMPTSQAEACYSIERLHLN